MNDVRVDMVTGQESPRSPELWKRALGINVGYVTKELVEAGESIYQDGIIVGAPYKRWAFNEAIRRGIKVHEDAQQTGVVNFLTPSGAYNTDVAGIQAMFERFFIPMDARVLVAGTGATAESVLYVLRSLVVRRYHWGRNNEAGQALMMKQQSNFLPMGKYENGDLDQWFEVVINTTPLSSHLMPVPLKHHWNVSKGTFASTMARAQAARAMTILTGVNESELRGKL